MPDTTPRPVTMHWLHQRKRRGANNKCTTASYALPIHTVTYLLLAGCQCMGAPTGAFCRPLTSCIHSHSHNTHIAGTAASSAPLVQPMQQHPACSLLPPSQPQQQQQRSSHTVSAPCCWCNSIHLLLLLGLVWLRQADWLLGLDKQRPAGCVHGAPRLVSELCVEPDLAPLHGLNGRLADDGGLSRQGLATTCGGGRGSGCRSWPHTWEAACWQKCRRW